MSQLRHDVVAPRHESGRNIGVDLARGLAVLAMVIAHVKHWAPTPPEPLATILSQLNNLASPFFGLVMGVSLGLVLGRAPLTARARAVLIAQNVVRGLLLVLLGLALQELGTFIAIVLQVLGLVLIVGTPIAMLGRVVSGVVAAVLFVVGPSVNDWARGTFSPVRLYDTSLDSQLLQWLFLSSSYRLTNLLPLFLLGVVLAGMGLRTRTALATLAVGAPVYVVATIRRELAANVVSGSLLDNFCDLGLALSAFGIAMLVGQLPWLGWLRTLLTPVRAMGTLALSAYAFHVALIALFVKTMGVQAYARWPLPVTVVLVATVLTTWAWWRWVGKGPIEVLMGWASGRYPLRRA